ncbi:MAG: hypothetical protein V4443_09110 [Pseudomonadota bacterium]
MKHFSIYILATISTTALASPCTGIDRTLTEERKAILLPIITKQVAQQLHNVESVEVLQSFHYRDWYIINVNTHVSDEGYLFYKGDPSKNNYLTILAGAYTKDDERFVLKSIQDGKAKGIPKALARCIAWHVTKGQSQ